MGWLDAHESYVMEIIARDRVEELRSTVEVATAYIECTAPDLVHGPPLEHGSCGSPDQASANLTVGTPESNGATANSTGYVRLGVTVGIPGPPDDSDVQIDVSLTDVRCQAGVATCGPANLGGGDDYTGELQADLPVRITDSNHTGGDTGTTQDASFLVTLGCAATANDRGGACTVSTTANAVVPGSVIDGQRAIWALGAIRVMDGGPDGDADTAGDNSVFATQGLFVP